MQRIRFAAAVQSRQIWASLSIAVLLVIASSCASYEASALRHEDASRKTHGWEEDKFVCAAVLRNAEHWQQRYLGATVTDHDILPVEVFLQNMNANVAGQDYSFEVSVRDAQLVQAGIGSDGGAIAKWQQVRVDDILRDTSYSQWRSALFWPLLIVPGWIVSSSVSSANMAMADDYRTKSLRDIRLVAGDTSVSGILFFRPESGYLESYDLTDSTIELTVTRSGGSEAGRRYDVRVQLREER